MVNYNNITHHKHLTLGAVSTLIIVRDEMLLAQSMAVEQQRSNIGGGGRGLGHDTLWVVESYTKQRLTCVLIPNMKTLK